MKEFLIQILRKMFPIKKEASIEKWLSENNYIDIKLPESNAKFRAICRSAEWTIVEIRVPLYGKNLLYRDAPGEYTMFNIMYYQDLAVKLIPISYYTNEFRSSEMRYMLLDDLYEIIMSDANSNMYMFKNVKVSVE